jgi:hypothetical protein
LPADRRERRSQSGSGQAVGQVPTIEAIPNGWSFTHTDVNHPKVGVRHPVDPFRWGYWTGGDTRVTEDFYRTVAHEVCGHMVPLILSIPSGRGSGRGHNEAIIRENRIAAEHGVSTREQRGLDRPEGGITPGRHRGESFLQATLPGFANGSSALPSGLDRIITSAIGTIRHFTPIQGDRRRIQLEGFAFRAEGGTRLAQQRIDEVRNAFVIRLMTTGISLVFIPPGSSVPVFRFGPEIAGIASGSPTAAGASRKRCVRIYLYHRAHSAGP